eukprot:Skav214604  [mRNA]  locus=scaffold57:882814:895102:- [translate_table: standard]
MVWFFALFSLVTVGASLADDPETCLMQKPTVEESLLGTDSGAVQPIQGPPPVVPIYLCGGVGNGAKCNCRPLQGSFATRPLGTRPIDAAFINECNLRCQGQPTFHVRDHARFGVECYCCQGGGWQLGQTGADESYVYQVVVPPSTTTTTSGAIVIGDPHIVTLDGQRYTLLSQGTFSLWHFSGLEAVPTVKGHKESHQDAVKRLPVDWQVYTHYSGHQSFTKGLLLVDQSGGKQRQVLELTSSDCQWRVQNGKQEWATVKSGESLLVPDDHGDFVTGFTVAKKDGPNGYNHVRLTMQTEEGPTDIAVLSLSCRPNKHINLEMVMKRRTQRTPILSDQQFVDGELKVSRKLQLLQSSTDSDFKVSSSWVDLGGSAQAALYFQSVDEMNAWPQLLSTKCSEAEETQAKETCRKHLGALVLSSIFSAQAHAAMSELHILSDAKGQAEAAPGEARASSAAQQAEVAVHARQAAEVER